MVINNLAQSSKPYYIRDTHGSLLQGKVAPASFVQVTPPGKPPYTVSMECNGIEGIDSADVIVSWYSPSKTGIVATHPGSNAAGSDE